MRRFLALTAVLLGLRPAAPDVRGRTTNQAPAPADAASYPLSQCAIVQLGDAPRLYLARPDGELAAVDVTTGAELWHTKDAMLPLLARHERVLALLPTPRGTPSWDLAVLDARSGRVLVRLPAWDSTAAQWAGGHVGSGPVTATRIEGVSRGGDDYVVWRRTVRVFSGGAPHAGPDPAPLHYSGAARVDLVNGTVALVRETVPSALPELHFDSPRTTHLGPFTLDGVTIVVALDSVGRQFRSVLRRSRDSTPLPDVVLCRRPWGGTWVSVSANGRHVAAACRVGAPTQHDRFDFLVYSTVTAQRVGALRNQSVASWVVWHTTLISLSDSVALTDLATGRRRFAVPVLSESRLTYQEHVPAAPPRARP